MLPTPLNPREQAAYCARIGIDALPADGAGLAAIQRAQRLAIPFENLDIILGRGISVDPDRVFAKLVGDRRGGYCFEQNQLFLRALLAAGFSARPLLARVWLMAGDEMPPKTHTLNLVTLDGTLWIADAGFGGLFTPPLPLVDGAESVTPDGARHRLIARDKAGEGVWMLQRDAGEGWADQYSFTLQPVFPGDLAMGNHWTATAPATRFTTLRIASLVTQGGLIALTDRSFTEREDGQTRAHEIADAENYRRVLDERFGLMLDAREVAALGLF
ncbi:N-hydroxyarylamine O-acetyltransferase [Sphingomonas sp. DBB INV C78]|uniref:arylamine N-acetyltransferase family protein n=1 Tax=Sphingomonas sp. DBB INV C78 TaxID=3349434 RepID=UPI0036D34B41